MNIILRPGYLLPYYVGLLLMLLLASLPEVQATHLKAGEITAKRDTTANPNPYRYFFTLVIYTDRASIYENQTIMVNNGDGTQRTLPGGPVRSISPETDQEVIRWEHTYPAPGVYPVSWVGVNRNGRILNVAAPSDSHSFYLVTIISISPFRGFNSTPVLKNPPIEVANVGRRFVHNPGAFDADGDSLSFRLIPPRRQAPNSPNIIDIPGYVLPSSAFSCRNSTDTGPGNFTMNPVTGQIVWDAPCRQGYYTIAFAVEEWRITATGAVKIGEVMRDMQITVKEGPNRPPVLMPKDTCVVAGTTLEGVIRATDADNDLINLTATSGIIPPAQFWPGTGNATTRGLAIGYFRWFTTCSDVRDEPYQVLFRAEDIRSNVTERLTDLQPWNIYVVAPPPQQLEAARLGNNVQLTWNSYSCQNAATIRIYRRQGTGNFVPTNCQTGVPASSGFTLVGEVTKDATAFLDTNKGQGLPASNQYCYLIYAEFSSPGRGWSIASAAACIPAGPMSLKTELEQAVQVYPNPAQGRLQVELPDNTGWESLRIYNITGMLVLERQGNRQNNISLELPQTATGLHLVQIRTKAGIITMRVLLE